MNILLLTSHAIAEYDDLRMFTDLGYNVFSIGGAYDEVPFEGKRPPLEVTRYPGFMEACNRQRAKLAEMRGDPGPYIDWAKAEIHPDIVEWADVIIVHHFPERWIGDQWHQIKHKRVIWRTCGQSDPRLESTMGSLHRIGMEIVRYSPNERKAFEPTGMFAGEDALIRFGKYPEDYEPWTGKDAVIGNITQDMAKRGDACGYDRWVRLTEGFPVSPAGPGSEVMGGLGSLEYAEMLKYLRGIRCYLYTGTIPASYTLGLMEAMLAGIPIMARGWDTPSLDWQWLGRLWEGSDIVHPGFAGTDYLIRERFRLWLDDVEYARMCGEEGRQRAIELFGIDTVGAQWKAFLG